MTRGAAYRQARASGESIARALQVAQLYEADPIPSARGPAAPWADFADAEEQRIIRHDVYIDVVRVEA